MKKPAEFADLGEVIVVSEVFQLNTFQTVSYLEKGIMEVFKDREAFFEKYGDKDDYEELEDWCELSTGKIFTKVKQ
ncbi:MULTISPECIES: hypothetical protein [Bacillaceae]|uniref:Uncharacterized protein n=1 Tax=Evansella alkalicola TaxID=745819 RepID=A0ABS6JYY8_9BACI|nr:MULTISPECIES: hypothetical protein [Bacillaceae]MBU9723301.1 hypothetical protein [Bacillus alkalicola]